MNRLPLGTLQENPFLAALVEESDRLMHRDIARVQLALQQRCDEVFEEDFATLVTRHTPEEARRLALEKVRAFRAERRPAVEEIKRILKEARDHRNEFFGVFLDYYGLASRVAPAE